MGEFATAVTAHLARHHILVGDLRIDKRTLEDAFTALTGRTLD
jgi:ABC-2 type transport system ATP-binding protein